jgi:mycothiol synthase
MLTTRRYETGDDLRRLCQFIAESCTATYAHAGDIQLRFADPTLNCEEEVRLWENDGQLVGFAIVQRSCFELVFGVKPGVWRHEVETQLTGWVTERMKRAAKERGQPTYFSSVVREYDVESISLLERYGFTRDEQYFVHVHYSFDSEIPASELPEEFTVRHLTGAHELEAYVAAHRNAFWMDNLTVEWRRRVLQMPFYMPELDLIATTPDGEIAAFCLCWLEQTGDDLKGLKKGYVPFIGTRPKFQKMGIGRAILLEAQRRLQALGAHVAFGQTDAINMQALRVWERAGVHPLYKIYRYFWMSEVEPEEHA